MVMTILEARVAQEKWTVLEQAFNLAVQHRDPGLVQTFLIHNLREPEVWRLLTVWESREALETMRSSGETPRGVLIFREAGAEPVLSVYAVVGHLAPSG